jgi:hypothetical protein
MSYNKFSKSNVNKFGSQKVYPISGLTPTMEEGLNTAIPIWQLLSIIEEQYDKLYKTPIIEELEKKMNKANMP